MALRIGIPSAKLRRIKNRLKVGARRILGAKKKSIEKKPKKKNIAKRKTKRS